MLLAAKGLISQVFHQSESRSERTCSRDVVPILSSEGLAPANSKETFVFQRAKEGCVRGSTAAIPTSED